MRPTPSPSSTNRIVARPAHLAHLAYLAYLISAGGLIGAVALMGCGSTQTRVQHGPAARLKARWAMLPFENHSEAPQAGERVEAMLATILRTRGVSGLEMYPAPKDDEAHLTASDRQRYEEALSWAQTQHVDYAVAGSVEEWRYKSGLDGEPAVGVSVRVFDVATKRVLWSASGTRSGTGGENASGAALSLMDSMVKELDVVP